MRVTKPLTETWVENFNKLFQFHPDREQIMEKILGDDLISRGQIDKWFHEAEEHAYVRLQIQMQEIMES